MSFCSNCGAEVKEGQAICLSCGFALKSNTAPVDVDAPDYSHRVKHDVFKLWPVFEDGPVGRMEYFVSLLKISGIAIGMFVLMSLFGVAAESGSAATLPLAILGLVAFAVLFLLLVHQVALVYKRFWDLGVEERGSRFGLTVGYFIVAMVPVLNLATLAMFFIPGKGKQ